MSGMLTGVLTFALVLLIYAFIWLIRKRRPGAASSGSTGQGSNGSSSAGIIQREISGLRLETELAAVAKDPEWREWDNDDKMTFGPVPTGERVFSNHHGDVALGIVDGRVYRIAITSEVAEAETTLKRFTESYGRPLRLRKGWNTWEDAGTRLDLAVRGVELRITLTDKSLARTAWGGAARPADAAPPHRNGLFNSDAFGAAGFGAEVGSAGAIEIFGRLACLVLTILSYQLRWWAPLVVAPLFHQIYEWPFISMKVDWVIYNRGVKLIANILTWGFYFGYIGLAIFLFSVHFGHWYGWLVGVGAGIVVTRFLGFLFPVRWRHERAHDVL